MDFSERLWILFLLMQTGQCFVVVADVVVVVVIVDVVVVVVIVLSEPDLGVSNN